MITTSIYTLVYILSMYLAGHAYKVAKHQAGAIKSSNAQRRKMPVLLIILVSMMYVVFNMYVTQVEGFFPGDRVNYNRQFHSKSGSVSVGLGIVFQIARIVSGDIATVFYTTTFISVGMFLLAYRLSDDAKPEVMLLMFLSQFIISSLVNLKQSYTNAMAALFFVASLQDREHRNALLCVFLIAAASLFHPTGFVLIPVYFLMNGSRKRFLRWLFYVMLIFILLFFDNATSLVGVVTAKVFPTFSIKMMQYFSDASASTFAPDDTSAFVFLKGFPFYYIAVLGIANRKRLFKKVANYDKYLLATIVGAVINLASVYEYWLIRAIFLFYFPMFTFFTVLVRNTYIRTNKIIHWFFVGGSLAILLYRYLFLLFW